MAKPKQKYVYACIRITPEARDIAHTYQENVDELNPNEPIGGIAQNSVDLDEDGVIAYRSASNLLHIEEVVEASADGWDDDQPSIDANDFSIDSVRVPSDEDLSYMKLLWSRSDSKGQGQGVTIAVLDTGLGSAVANIFKNMGILKEAKSFIGENPTNASNNHGSHVASTALPDKAKLLHAQVLGDSGNGSSDGIIKAIYWAVENGADFINMSLSGPSGLQQYEPALQHARSKGCIVFCAAGNEAQKGNPLRYPAACPSAVAVAAFDRTTDRKADFSSFHSYVDVAGSGVAVYALYANGSLGAMNGTSMATPCVVYGATVLKGKDLRKSNKTVLQAILSSARNTSAPATYEGNGVFNGWNALKKLGFKVSSASYDNITVEGV